MKYFIAGIVIFSAGVAVLWMEQHRTYRVLGWRAAMEEKNTLPLAIAAIEREATQLAKALNETHIADNHYGQIEKQIAELNERKAVLNMRKEKADAMAADLDPFQ